jgi:leucyl-tRNA synthetase
MIVEQTVEIVVQINGKVKGKLTVSRDSTQEAVSEQARSLLPVKQALVGTASSGLCFYPIS